MSTPAAGSPSRRRITALGGGHGLAATLRALRRLDVDITAVVGVADDGRSSGRLRATLGVLPPGDLRMALAALAGGGPEGDLWIRVLQHRFGGGGDIGGHVVGNLLIAALWEETADVVAGLDALARAVRARGRVLPNCLDPVDLVADLGPDVGGEVRRIRGQALLSATPGHVTRLAIEPAEPTECREAVDAIRHADVVVVGPGSWYTSVLPHLLVPSIAAALGATPACRVLVLNLGPERGETEYFLPQTHLEVWADLAPEQGLDVVVVDPSVVPDLEALRAAADRVGAELLLHPLLATEGVHDPNLLAAALAGVLDRGRMTQWP